MQQKYLELILLISYKRMYVDILWLRNLTGNDETKIPKLIFFLTFEPTSAAVGQEKSWFVGHRKDLRIAYNLTDCI